MTPTPRAAQRELQIAGSATKPDSRPPLGLYVHIPWCEKKCPYCDFNSHEALSRPETRYVDTLLRDLEFEYEDEDRRLTSIFIGGGTPSLFSESSIRRLMEGIRSRTAISDDAEITMEANPGSVERDRLAGYADAGINRFSLGIQSFNDRSLQHLGRVHDGEAAKCAVQRARDSGAQTFNLDLMHGLPHQSAEDGLEDLLTGIALAPPHISWYQLTIEPNTRFYSKPPPLPVEEVLGSLEDSGAALLRESGYRQYEVSAWSRPGEECRHNLNYWSFGDYLAIGAGAHGKLTSAQGVVHRYSKTRQPEDYLRGGTTRNDAPGGIERRGSRVLEAADLRGEFAMNALRLNSGFTYGLFEARTGLSAQSIQPIVDTQRELGLLEMAADCVRATARGQRYLDNLVAAFFEGTRRV
ncbi:MAG: radical SAM family heme chaperone HemW [Pseudomonadota bacterium]